MQKIIKFMSLFKSGDPGYRVLGGVSAELPIEVGASIGWLQYSWIWFLKFFKESSDHSMVHRPIASF
ncbi:hypothetical protein L6164_024249 [Bauhinia variegata]|uniref:Uncharacterized protein n=1 Tax=Bauhinia variegata TaxID=167791 RepID=A0ACB9LWY1_BAUVA|nr:hypothetical protein L6164_024249 [Bauhinia variegata]